MSLNIGDINFTVDANTAGLKSAVAEMARFRKVVNSAARAQGDGAATAAAALGRQESATKRAFQQTLNLQRALRESGAPVQQITNVTKAFQRLTREMHTGQLGTVKFSRAQDAFAARLGRSSRAMKNLKAKEAAARVSKLGEVMRDLESASVLAVGPLSGLGARIRALGAITSRSTLKIAAMLGAVTGVIVVLGKLSIAAVTTARAMGEINSTLTVATGSSVLAAREFRKVATIADEMGIEIQSAAKQYAALAAAARGTTLEGKATRDLFEATARAGAALKLSTVDVEGALRALQQMISKGTVSSEELRQQFGERIPGALNLAAASMGVTTQQLSDMLRKGEVLAVDLLPKLTAEMNKTFGPQAKANVNSLNGSINSLHNAMFKFARTIDNTFQVSRTFRNGVVATTEALNSMSRNLDIILGILGAVTGGLLGMVSPAIIGGMIRLGQVLLVVVRALFAGAGALALFTSRLSVKGFFKLIATVLGAVAGFKLLSSTVRGTTEDMSRLIMETQAFVATARLMGNVTLGSKNEFIGEIEEGIVTLTSELGQLRETAKQAKADLARVALENPEFGFRFGEGDELLGIQNQITITKDQLAKLRDLLKQVQKLPIRTDPAAAGDVDKYKEFIMRLKESNTLMGVQLRLGRDAREQEEALIAARRKGIDMTVPGRADHIKDLVRTRQELQKQAQFVSEISRGFAGAINEGLQDAVFEGTRLKDVLDNIAESMARIAIQAALVRPLTDAFSMAIGGSPMYAAAGGGRSPGGVTLVGEKGPELVDLPRGSVVTPSASLGGGGVTVNVTNSVPAAGVEVTKSNSADGSQIIEVLIAEVDKRISGGGSTQGAIASTFGLNRSPIMR